MSRRSMTCAWVAGAVVLMAVVTTPGNAKVVVAEGPTAACTVDVGSVTAAGDHTFNRITAGRPPTMTVVPRRAATGVYAPGQVRLSTTLVNHPDGFGSAIVGWVVQGAVLYRSSYSLDFNGGLQEPPLLIRVGGGWTNFKMVEEAEYVEVEHQPALRTTEYGLTNDGLLVRWRNLNGVWRKTGSGSGFESVKAMALISKTRTYDTFLANTRGGALYTIRISTAVPPTFVVKLVRRATWQAFEKLIAVKCGLYGTLLLGIDKDTNSGYLYAVGHGNGLSTVIQGLGKVQGSFPDPVDFRWRFVFDPLNGE